MPRRHDLELLLKQSEIFKRLTPTQRERLVAGSQEKSYGRGQTLFHEGTPSNNVWFVLKGRAHLVHYTAAGRMQTTCVMTPGESFCCLPALDRGSYPATAVAATPLTVLRVPTELFHEMIEESPAFSQETLCVFCSRLRQVEAKGCMAFDPVDQRVAQALVTLRKKFGPEIPLTKQEIAELVGTTVETAIRVISRFQREGWVRSSRGKIQIVKPQALAQLFS